MTVPPQKPRDPQPPLHREVHVRAAPDRAFARFTDDIGRWWPLGRHSVHGAGGTVAFRDGLIVETGPEGGEAVWGEVLDWEPPHRLRVTWHPGRAGGPATEVEVRFEASGDGTRVVLVHRGWEALADPAAARTEYDSGWPTVLAAYADPVWVALLHTPAPGVEPATVSASPDFAEHLAFLGRLRERGWLVAAGPFADEAGCGMTVLRVPPTDGVDEAERLARSDDQSVVRGLLAVQVRPWRVVVQA